MTFGRWNPAPPLWYWFRKMHDRVVRYNLLCDFPCNEEGYRKFIEAIGPIPDGMRSPTVGRYDHTQGYVFDRFVWRWNFSWQEKSENSSESAARNNLTKIGNRRSAASPRRNSLRTVACPHCGQKGRLPPMKRWHFDRCRQ